MAPSHVLVPLDGSPLADDALVHALELFDGEITVLNVVTPLDAAMSESGVLEVDVAREMAARERADHIVEQARQQAAAAGRDVTTVVEAGEPADTIIEFAGSHDVEHIVMGGHGGTREELRRRLLGTVATSVVGKAPVSVTVIR